LDHFGNPTWLPGTNASEYLTNQVFSQLAYAFIPLFIQQMPVRA
jgi:hypothetical protein